MANQARTFINTGRISASNKKVLAFTVFFPAAALYAALIVPLSVYAMTGGGLIALAGAGHAREMLFGFVLALVAGYLLGPVKRLHLLLLFALWLFARTSYLFAPYSLITDILNPSFALVLAVILIPRFSSAKKWRNRMVQPLLLLIFLVPILYSAAGHFSGLSIGAGLFPGMILLLSLLMSFFGGRVLAPAAAGAYYRLGMNLAARVQPRIEAAIVITHAIALAMLFLPSATWLAGAALCSCGILTAVRLLRWQLSGLTHCRDLIGLGIGYGWLALGQFLFGILLFFGRSPVPAIHLITVGALGTLSVCIILRVHYQRIKLDIAEAVLLIPSVLLMTIASLARFCAGLHYPAYETLLWISALTWSLAWLLTAAQLFTQQFSTLQLPSRQDAKKEEK